MKFCSKGNKIYLVENDIATIEITNFDYYIDKDVEYLNDDGSSIHVYEIHIITEFGEKLKPIKVTSDDYVKGQWYTKLGSNGIVSNARNFKIVVIEKLRSEAIKHIKKYRWIGMTEEDGEVFYIDNGGKISANSYDESVKSELDEKLGFYHLPKPENDEKVIKDLIKEVFELEKLAKNNFHIGILVKAAPVRAMIRSYLRNTAVWTITAETGVKKSATAAIIQSFSGPKFHDQSNLPADWKSTEAALENLTVIVKGLLVIDEFTPLKNMTQNDLENKAERVIRGIANGQARRRSNAQGITQFSSPPEALVLITGEAMNLQIAESLERRMIFFTIKKCEIDNKELTHFQHLAKNGVYASFSAVFIQFLLKNHEAFKTKIPKEFERFRKIANEDLGQDFHARYSENMASIMISLSVFYSFAKKFGVISEAERKEYLDRDWENLKHLMYSQKAIVKQLNVGYIFVKSLKNGFRTGKYYLKDHKTNEQPPKDISSIYGWKNNEPRGCFIGWIDSSQNRVFIKADMDIRYLLDNIPSDYKEHFPETPKAFWKHIKQAGYLRNSDKDSNRIRITQPFTKKTTTVYEIKFELNE